MRFAVLKKYVLLLAATVFIFFALFFIGLSLSYFVHEETVNTLQNINTGYFNIWRWFFYIALLVAWPWFITRLIKKRLNKQAISPSRLPLFVLIILYELIIVQNPLAAVLRLF